MIWLDSVLALPGIGIGFEAPLSERLGFRERLIPVIEQDTGLVQLVFPHGSIFEMEAKFDSGFQIKLTESRIIADFGYAADQTKVPGKLPHF